MKGSKTPSAKQILLVKEEVSCEGSPSWREPCTNKVLYSVFGGEHFGPSYGSGVVRYCCSDPVHKKIVGSYFQHPRFTFISVMDPFQ